MALHDLARIYNHTTNIDNTYYVMNLTKENKNMMKTPKEHGTLYSLGFHDARVNYQSQAYFGYSKDYMLGYGAYLNLNYDSVDDKQLTQFDDGVTKMYKRMEA